MYASNRGHDSIAIFTVDPASGRLANIGWENQRQNPGFFTLEPFGTWLFVANEDSDSIVTFRGRPADRDAVVSRCGHAYGQPGMHHLRGHDINLIRRFPPLRVAFAARAGALPSNMQQTRTFRRE